MKRLTCEMCGSSDLIKENGVFVCQNCGTKYSVEEAKKMMVEGDVNVTGTVKVDNSESFLKRAELFLRDKKWDRAYTYFEKALDANPENPKAYIGIVLCKYHCSTIEELKGVVENVDITNDEYFTKAVHFNNIEGSDEITDLLQYIANSREIEKSVDHKKMINDKANQAEIIKRNVIVVGNNIYALKADGTVYAAGDNKYGQCNF